VLELSVPESWPLLPGSPTRCYFSSFSVPPLAEPLAETIP